jgi:hypothetical protein
VICQLHAQALVFLGEESPVIIEKEAGWLSEAIRMIWNSKKSLSAVGDQHYDPSAIQRVL